MDEKKDTKDILKSSSMVWRHTFPETCKGIAKTGKDGFIFN